MITAIEIENFKAFGDAVRIDLSPLTLLFGPNSGGKSSVLHAIHYAREIFLRGVCDVHRTESGAEVVDLGGIRRLVHGREAGERSVVLTFHFSLENGFLPEYHSFGAVDLDVPVYLAWPLDFNTILEGVETAAVRIVVDTSYPSHVAEYWTWVNGEPIARIKASRGKPAVDLTDINWGHSLFQSNTETDEELKDLGEEFRRMDTVARKADEEEIADQAREHADEIERGLELSGTLAEEFEKAGGTPERGTVLQAVRGSGYGNRCTTALPEWGRPLGIKFPTEADPEDEELLGARKAFVDLLSTLVVGPGEKLAELLEGFRYIGPLRTVPSRSMGHPEPTGPSRWPSGLAAWEHLQNADEKLIEEVSDWLWSDERLDTGYRLEVLPYREVSDAIATRMVQSEADPDIDSGEMRVHDQWRSLEEHRRVVLVDHARGLHLQPLDVGVGLSQLVPVLVAVLDPEVPLVAVEQPELHLHPKQQAALGDVLIKGALQSEGRNILVETHSEHLILRLLRRIRETTKEIAPPGLMLRADQLRVLYVSPTESTSSEIREMHIDVEGNFVEPWPDDFFEQDFKERFA